MATYKEIKGVTLQTLSEDPVQNVGSWSSGPSINTARFQTAGAGATQNAGYIIGGAIPPATPNISALHEQFDGSSWTEAGDLGTANYAVATFGTPSSAVSAGGYDGAYENDVYIWNGSSWTSGTALNTIRAYSGASGVTTAGIVYGGSTPPNTGATETFNGSSWTNVPSMNTARVKMGQANNGTTTATISSGGNPSPGPGAAVEQFDGSSWTETTELNTGRDGQWGFGTSTAQIVAGSTNSPVTAKTESWNGTAWTEVNDLGTASGANAGSGTGTATSGIVAAAYSGSFTGLTISETWDFPPVTAAILNEGDVFLSGGTSLKGFGKAAGIPSTSWAAGAAQNTTRVRQAATGGNATISVAQLCGGYLPSSPPPNDYFTNTEQYNGSAWTEVNDLNTAKSSMSGFGTQTSAIVAGSPGGIPPQAQTEAWDGTSWAGTADLNNGRGEGTGAGLTGTAGIVAAGKVPTNNYQAHSETWNGTAWTETSNTNSSKSDLGAGGSQTSAVIFGGTPGTKNETETWDGSSWTEVNNLNEGRYGVQGGGVSSSSALAAGGDDGSRVASTEFWNGTSWTELNDLSTARSHTQQCPGNAVSMVFSGGYPDSSASPAEEWASDNALSTVSVS